MSDYGFSSGAWTPRITLGPTLEIFLSPKVAELCFGHSPTDDQVAKLGALAKAVLGESIKNAPSNLYDIKEETLLLKTIMLDAGKGTWLSSPPLAVREARRCITTGLSIKYGCHNLDHFQDVPTFLMLFQCWIDWVDWMVDEADL
ncbi:hypothetical protein COB52_03315 [Candidatus Kaiserbacteria bacterium]|nr:MAG: hypothetical protein COB52_03315 [Candidatus Kaiserbacteria bacterium]